MIRLRITLLDACDAQAAADLHSRMTMTKQDMKHPPTVRETEVRFDGLPIIVALHPRYLELRLKGRRYGTRIAYDVIFDHSIKRNGVVEDINGSRLAPGRNGDSQ